MKLNLMAVTILTANLAIAATPNVVCELHYSRSSAQGDVDMQVQTVKPEMYETSQLQIEGFKLNVTLEPICPAGGHCTEENFAVKTTLSKNSVSTSTSLQLKEKFDQHFAQLTVGDKQVYAICQLQD